MHVPFSRYACKINALITHEPHIRFSKFQVIFQDVSPFKNPANKNVSIFLSKLELYRIIAFMLHVSINNVTQDYDRTIFLHTV